MKRRFLVTILTVAVFFTGAAQNVSAYVNEDWRYDEDMYEKYWEEKEKEESDRRQQAMYDELAKRREEQAIVEMEKKAEQEKKDAAYDGAYVDFDDKERYLSGLEEDLLGEVYGSNEEVMIYDEKGVTLCPTYKIDSKLKKLLKDCKRVSKRFKYTISNKKNTIKMSHDSYKKLITYILDKYQQEADKMIGMEQDGIFKDFDFAITDFELTVYVTDQFASEYTYANKLFEDKAKDLLYVLKFYGMILGADQDDLRINIVDVYTEETYFSNL